MRELAVILPVLATFLAGSAAAARAQEVGVTIIEHGLYTAQTVRVEHLPSGFNSNVVQNICHVATTETVPAKMGVQFGFRFHVDGAPVGAVIELRRVTRFPSPLKPPTAAAALSESEQPLSVRIGASSYVGFGFDHSWEVVTGPWSIELWQSDRLLARQGFEIKEGMTPKEAPKMNDNNCFQLSASLTKNMKTGGMP